MSQAGLGATQTVSLIVPAYNEGGHIYRNLEVLWQHLRNGPYSFEIVVIDDGSSDGTGSEILRFAENHDSVTVLTHVSNLGIGQALRSGFRAATGTYLISFDSDLSYSPDHIDRLVETIATTGAKVVVASPYMEGGSVENIPRLRAILSRVANRLLRTLSISHTSTITGMVRAYDRRFIKGISFKSNNNQINPEIIYKAALLREPIVEIPATLRWTRSEEDTRKRRRSFSVVRTTVDFLFSGFIFRPFIFFILPGMLALLLAFYSLIWAAFHTIRFLPDDAEDLDSLISSALADAFALSPHSFVIGGIALVFASQLISLGILSAQNKRYFEEMFYQGNWLSKHLNPDETTRVEGSEARTAVPSGQQVSTSDSEG